MSNAMATASALNTTDSDLLQESIDESILPGFSEDELLNLFQSGAVQSWDRVFYRLGLQMPQKGSGGSVNIITSLLSLWVERGGSSKIKLLDVLLQLKETYHLFLLLGVEHILFIFSRIGHDLSNVISSLDVKWKERCELAHAKFTDYLSNQQDVIQHSEEPLETLAKCFFEGCLREMDFSHAAKQSILKNALIDFGFTEDTIDPKVITTRIIDKEHLLEIVEKLTMKQDIENIISRDLKYQDFKKFMNDGLNMDLPPLMSCIIYCTSYSEYVTLLQNATIDTGIIGYSGFRVSPSGLIFNLPIKVSLDHCVTVLQREQACKEGIVVYIRQEEGPKEQWKVMRYDLSTSSDCPVKVTLTHDKAEVYVTHFTSFWIKVKSMFIGSKRIGCTPFLPKYMPSNRKPVLRLYVHHISAGTVKRIQEEEENSCPGYCRTTPHYDFMMIPNRGQLTVTCNDEGRIMHKTVSEEDLLTLRRRSQSRLEFELDFTSLNHMEKNVNVDLFQGDEERRRDMIIPTTFQATETGEDIASGMHGLSLDSGQASSQLDESGAAAGKKVTPKEIMDIAGMIPFNNFLRFFILLGFRKDYILKALERWSKSVKNASEELLSEWAEKRQSNKDELHRALCDSELQFLAHQCL